MIKFDGKSLEKLKIFSENKIYFNKLKKELQGETMRVVKDSGFKDLVDKTNAFDVVVSV
jgi:hypothetical protein